VRRKSQQTRARFQGSKETVPQRQRRRWSVASKRELVEEWQQSGLTRAQFCRQRNLHYGRFLAWIRGYTKQDQQFLEVKVGEEKCRPSASQPTGAVAEIISPAGWRLRLPTDCPTHSARQWLQLIVSC